MNITSLYIIQNCGAVPRYRLEEDHYFDKSGGYPIHYVDPKYYEFQSKKNVLERTAIYYLKYNQEIFVR
jgi:hypothetical protein